MNREYYVIQELKGDNLWQDVALLPCDSRSFDEAIKEMKYQQATFDMECRILILKEGRSTV